MANVETASNESDNTAAEDSNNKRVQDRRASLLRAKQLSTIDEGATTDPEGDCNGNDRSEEGKGFRANDSEDKVFEDAVEVENEDVDNLALLIKRSCQESMSPKAQQPRLEDEVTTTDKENLIQTNGEDDAEDFYTSIRRGIKRIEHHPVQRFPDLSLAGQRMALNAKGGPRCWRMPFRTQEYKKCQREGG